MDSDPEHRSVGCLALFFWSIIGTPGTALVLAEGLYRMLDLTSIALLITTFLLTNFISWLVFRACGFDPVRSLTYALISYAPVAVLFALYAHSVTNNLN